MLPAAGRAAAGLLALALAACGTGAAPVSAPAALWAAPAAAPAGPAAAPAALPCPTGYAAADPRRPVLTADLTVDGRTVRSRQRIVFTPDLATGEVVLRLWAAGPRSRAAGGAVTVDRVVINGVARTTKRPAPTLLRIPLAGRATVGRAMTIDVDSVVRLPVGANERFGHRDGVSWLAGGLPLLAWERGRGWATEPETGNVAEAVTSEAMRLDRLAVTRAAGLTVLSAGTPVSDDGRTAVFRSASVRDSALAVGRFRTARATAGSVPVLVGVAPGVRDDPAAVARELARAVRSHAARFGAYPHETLVSAVVPDLRGGVEMPGFVVLGTGQAAGDATASHEVAHQWWYSLVGDDQARDPWLDEAFATYAEAIDRGTGPAYERMTVPSDGRGRVGAPMTYWEGRSSYYRSVYVQGAVALLRARRAVGAAAMDRALRCHVARHAHTLTRPADVAASLRHLPAALAELRKVGAL